MSDWLSNDEHWAVCVVQDAIGYAPQHKSLEPAETP